MSLRLLSRHEFPLTLSEGKSQCRIHDEIDYFDADILHLIEVATGKVSSMTGLILADETWELTVSDPVGKVSLPLIPVSELVSVNGDQDVSEYTLAIDGDCATVVGDWPSGDVRIQFRAGGNAPVELKHAMRILISQWFRVHEATGEMVTEVPYAVEALVSDHRRGWVKA